MIRNTIAIVFAVTALSLSACNTVNGAGKDIKSAGTAVSQASGENGNNR